MRLVTSLLVFASQMEIKLSPGVHAGRNHLAAITEPGLNFEDGLFHSPHPTLLLFCHCTRLLLVQHLGTANVPQPQRTVPTPAYHLLPIWRQCYSDHFMFSIHQFVIYFQSASCILAVICRWSRSSPVVHSMARSSSKVTVMGQLKTPFDVCRRV